jgi:hypothetical protein
MSSDGSCQDPLRGILNPSGGDARRRQYCRPSHFDGILERREEYWRDAVVSNTWFTIYNASTLGSPVSSMGFSERSDPNLVGLHKNLS